MTDLHALAARWRHSARYPAEPANEWQRGEREALARCADELDAALREPPAPEPTAEEVERAAEAAHDRAFISGPRYRESSEGTEEIWRDIARAALTAARSRP